MSNYYLSTNNLAKKFPEIASEWDFEKNGDLKPTDVCRCDKTKVWWKCKNNHSWKISINNRTIGYGCPICNPRKTRGVIYG